MRQRTTTNLRISGLRCAVSLLDIAKLGPSTHACEGFCPLHGVNAETRHGVNAETRGCVGQYASNFARSEVVHAWSWSLGTHSTDLLGSRENRYHSWFLESAREPKHQVFKNRAGQTQWSRGGIDDLSTDRSEEEEKR